MSAPLNLILQRLDREPPILFADEVRSEIGPLLEPLSQIGILAETSGRGTIDCSQCGRRCRIEFSHGAADATAGFIACPECGIERVSNESRKRWQINVPACVTASFAAAVPALSLDEAVSRRLWRLGRASWAGRIREVYFARGYYSDDGHELISQMSRKPKAVLFVPTLQAVERWGTATANLVIGLDSVVGFDEESIRFDLEYVESLLEDAGLASTSKPKSKPRPKRGERAAKIESLEKEMIAHLISARDHAFATKQQTGTPALLERPTQNKLAQLTGMEDYDVSRCLDDSAGRELRLYWEIALNLDQIMKFDGAINRGRK